MRELFLLTISELRFNSIIRTILKPIMDVKNMLSSKKFIMSENSSRLRCFKNKHKGERCFIVGNGPSLSISDLELIKNETSFACNRIYEMYDKTTWRPQYYMCMDPRVYVDKNGVKDHLDDLHKSVIFLRDVFKKWGIKKSSNIYLYTTNYKIVKKLYCYNKVDINEDIAKGFSMNFSVVQNLMELAIYMGFSEIYLIGIDHNFPISINAKGKFEINNKIKDHIEGGGSSHRKFDRSYIYSLTSCYKAYKMYADKHDLRIINVSRYSKLEVFDKMKLEDALRRN